LLFVVVVITEIVLVFADASAVVVFVISVVACFVDVVVKVLQRIDDLLKCCVMNTRNDLLR